MTLFNNSFLFRSESCAYWSLSRCLLRSLGSVSNGLPLNVVDHYNS
jgi:hypothetical protein